MNFVNKSFEFGGPQNGYSYLSLKPEIVFIVHYLYALSIEPIPSYSLCDKVIQNFKHFYIYIQFEYSNYF